MGIVSSIFDIPDTPRQREDYKRYLDKTVTTMEAFVNSVKKKPSFSQQQYFLSSESEFKSVYKELVKHGSTDRELDAIMTRFGRVQNIWNHLIRPETYEPLKEPLLD